jgi:hypothetical protein
VLQAGCVLRSTWLGSLAYFTALVLLLLLLSSAEQNE